MIKHFIKTTKWFIEKCLNFFLVKIVTDEVYLKCIFRLRVGYCLNLNNPQTFNEKIQWLKLNDVHPEYTNLVDKIEVKHYVASKIGKQYIIPTIASWNSVADIDWGKLPNRFVIKCTGDSGGVVVCKNKQDLDIHNAEAKLLKGWGQNYYQYSKEYPYKNVVPRIIAEKYMEDESGFELKDYKFFCFDGIPRFLFVASDRQKKGVEVKFDFYDLNWNHLPIRNGHPNASENLVKPKNFEKMVDIARILSEGMKHVRVDLYNCNGDIYFGELTFFHFSGLTPFEPIEWDYKFGEYIRI